MKILERFVFLASAVMLVGCAIQTESEWSPVAATQSYEGKTLRALAIDWARWSYANTSCDSPDHDEDGSLCARYQPKNEPVFFFAGGNPGTSRTKCRVPAGKAIVVPLDVYTIDNGGVMESDQLSESELRDEGERFLGTVADLKLVVDEREISRLEDHEVGPTKFTYQLPNEPNWYSCHGQPGVSGTVDPAFVAGYFVVMSPPSLGKHSIEYAGVAEVGGKPVTSHVTAAFEVY